MLNLMRLEIIKFKLGSYIKGAVIANFVIVGLILSIMFISKFEGSTDFNNYQEVLTIIDSSVRGTFIIFAATLIAKLIIGEFKSKTITTLFMYPISRKKLIAAKLAIIILFTFCAIVITNLFVTAVFCFISESFQLLPDTLTASMITQLVPSVFMNAIAASGMSLVPLYFGMKKYSVPTTIVSSILIVMVISSNNGGFSLNDIIVIPIALALIGVGIAYLAIRNIEKIDVH
ncbi:ABC transporter permease [Sporosarcina limicola]|uniref:ABC-type transport system involved in multi-copper enzyme maturation permease subunit n=1 Tax=Sporosarcina limicola TaxID=34101 RepID=A0A927MLI8_9BACL|nr:ABC transporter permease [Sporosarcina limicola]MBE1556168.1 ABC-type transport system involved in multi-copper enzyme maturation permease subunit [Sporosarcina limicola]